MYGTCPQCGKQRLPLTGEEYNLFCQCSTKIAWCMKLCHKLGKIERAMKRTGSIADGEPRIAGNPFADYEATWEYLCRLLYDTTEEIAKKLGYLE